MHFTANALQTWAAEGSTDGSREHKPWRHMVHIYFLILNLWVSRHGSSAKLAISKWGKRPPTCVPALHRPPGTVMGTYEPALLEGKPLEGKSMPHSPPSQVCNPVCHFHSNTQSVPCTCREASSLQHPPGPFQVKLKELSDSLEPQTGR